MKTIYLLILISALFCVCDALRCYTCAYVANSNTNKACLDDPDKVDGANKYTNCNKKYCTTIRQDLLKPSGTVVSFLRGCDDTAVNQVFEDATYKMYFKACSTDLCNSGDGIKGGSGGVSAEGEHGANMVVPGVTDSASCIMHSKRGWAMAVALYFSIYACHFVA